MGIGRLFRLRKAMIRIRRGDFYPWPLAPARVTVWRVAMRETPPMVDSVNGSGLASSVLVLNRMYLAVHVVHVRRAVCLVFRNLAEVVHIEDGRFSNHDFDSWLEISELNSLEKRPDQDWIRSINFELQAPRVIRLLSYDRLPKQSIRFSRRNIFARDGHRCMYCNRRPSANQLSIDHVLPKSRGGHTCWENVVSCCIHCNIKKGGRTPHEARMKLLRKPERPKRSPLLTMKLCNPKYASWKIFVEHGQAAPDVI
jgi:5-methylcytosine-specific restriction endonuclease McrA